MTITMTTYYSRKGLEGACWKNLYLLYQVYFCVTKFNQKMELSLEEPEIPPMELGR